MSGPLLGSQMNDAGHGVDTERAVQRERSSSVTRSRGTSEGSRSRYARRQVVEYDDLGACGAKRKDQMGRYFPPRPYEPRHPETGTAPRRVPCQA